MEAESLDLKGVWRATKLVQYFVRVLFRVDEDILAPLYITPPEDCA